MPRLPPAAFLAVMTELRVPSEASRDDSLGNATNSFFASLESLGFEREGSGDATRGDEDEVPDMYSPDHSALLARMHSDRRSDADLCVSPDSARTSYLCVAAAYDHNELTAELSSRSLKGRRVVSGTSHDLLTHLRHVATQAVEIQPDGGAQWAGGKVMTSSAPGHAEPAQKEHLGFLTTFIITHRVFSKTRDVLGTLDSVLCNCPAEADMGGALLVLRTWLELAPEDFYAADVANDANDLLRYCGSDAC